MRIPWLNTRGIPAVLRDLLQHPLFTPTLYCPEQLHTPKAAAWAGPSREWRLWLGPALEKAKAGSGQAKAAAFGPSRAGTSLPISFAAAGLLQLFLGKRSSVLGAKAGKHSNPSLPIRQVVATLGVRRMPLDASELSSRIFGVLQLGQSVGRAAVRVSFCWGRRRCQ